MFYIILCVCVIIAKHTVAKLSILQKRNAFVMLCLVAKPYLQHGGVSV